MDWASHFTELKEEYQAERTRFLEAESVVILRFEGRVVFIRTSKLCSKRFVRLCESGVTDHPGRADHLR